MARRGWRPLQRMLAGLVGQYTQISAAEVLDGLLPLSGMLTPARELLSQAAPRTALNSACPSAHRWFPDHATTLLELVRRADQQMYVDKQSRPRRAEGVVRDLVARRSVPDRHRGDVSA